MHSGFGRLCDLLRRSAIDVPQVRTSATVITAVVRLPRRDCQVRGVVAKRPGAGRLDYGTSNLGGPTRAFLKIDCARAFIRSFSLMAQLLDGDSIYLLDEFMRDRFKLFQYRGGLINLSAGRKIF
jgi:hypothetical protein